MSARLVLATNNPGKVRELSGMLELGAGGVRVLSLADVGIGDLDEPAADFVGNAVAKAVQAAERTGIPALADDSGLSVDALGGAPGVFSARYAGAHGDDAANRAKLLERLEGVPEGSRGARFCCAVALADPSGALGGRTLVAAGQCGGVIARAPRGEHGFGYDPLFVPEGSSETMAEMTDEEKRRRSHRGRALRRMLPALRAYIERRWSTWK